MTGEGKETKEIFPVADRELVDKTLGHYRVIEKIGTGGMGDVYRAHDERLDREVAIKVLAPGSLGEVHSRKRFRKEALALSKLNHPNIATIHDFDTDHDVDYIVMEYIPGITLSGRLALINCPLPEREILALGTQLAEGLSAAHECGVVHSDLKPGNLRINSDGRLKILDFGLARLRSPTGSGDATASASDTEVLAGTLLYMAPEQLLSGQVDARTDVHGVGLVLYEMATGRQPFADVERSQLIGAILRSSPEPARSCNPRLSLEIERIITTCLEKDPRDRYQTGAELAADLRRLQAGSRSVKQAQPVSIASIAILPFTNLSAETRQEYFADGVTESLITDLGRLTGLKTVIARGSVMRYKNTQKSPAEIARELNVDALMTGAVLRSGNRLRVTAQLIQPETAQQLWTEHYEFDLKDVLQVQSEATRAIAAELRVKLTAKERAHLSTVRSIDPEAYDSYLLGRYHWFKMSPQGLDRAAEYFQLSLDKDPNYAPAYAGFGFIWSIRAHTGLLPSREGHTKAKAYALKALEIDSSQPEAHDLLAGFLVWYEWNWQAGEEEYKRAIELNSNYADVRCFYSYFLHAMGRSEEAHHQIERALELDPYNFFFHMALGMELNDEHRPDEALIHLERAATLQPENLFVHWNLWYVFEQKRDYLKAVAEARQYFTVLGARDVVRALQRGYTQAGYRHAMRLAAEALVGKSRKTFVSPIDIALLYASAGESDRSLDWLERAYEEHASRLPYLNVLFPLNPLRSQPRFQEIQRRMNFPQSIPPERESRMLTSQSSTIT